METYQYGGSDATFKALGPGGVVVVGAHIRCGAGTCVRAVQIDGVFSLYLDADDRVIGIHVMGVLPSNVRQPAPPSGGGKEATGG